MYFARWLRYVASFLSQAKKYLWPWKIALVTIELKKIELQRLNLAWICASENYNTGREIIDIIWINFLNTSVQVPSSYTFLILSQRHMKSRICITVHHDFKLSSLAYLHS